ncbi:unnamed protein product, partial [Rotaria magnacalcarata]
TLQIDQDSHDISTSHNADTISIIFEPSKENTIIEQIDTLPTVVNAFDQKQEITSVVLSAYLFNTNTSSIPNEASSKFFFKDKSLNPNENLNDNDQILIDNDQNNINSTYSREIHNLTSNVEVRNITSPITNTSLPTSFMLGIVDQILSNNSNESMSITSTQPQINHTTELNNSLPTSSNIQDSTIFEFNKPKPKKPKRMLKRKNTHKRKTINNNIIFHSSINLQLNLLNAHLCYI